MDNAQVQWKGSDPFAFGLNNSANAIHPLHHDFGG